MPQFSEAEQSFAAMMFAGIASGMPPAEVAEKVFAAIQNEQFYIFPHPEFLPAVRARMEAILEQRNPTSILSTEARPGISLPESEQ
jgi:hypothetical protein